MRPTRPQLCVGCRLRASILPYRAGSSGPSAVSCARRDSTHTPDALSFVVAGQAWGPGRVTFQAALRYRKPAVLSPQGALQEDAGAWDDTHHGGMGLEVEIPRSTWVKEVLEPIGTSRYIWMELLIPTLPTGRKWLKVQEHLEKAEARDHEGADPDVLRHCHDALSALSPRSPKTILPAVADQDKKDKLDRALQDFRAFLQNGRHPQQTGGYDVDHRDAQFALAMTKVWLTYIARLEST
jgi:hypothetical protein